jgi:hypothetical protein
VAQTQAVFLRTCARVPEHRVKQTRKVARAGDVGAIGSRTRRPARGVMSTHCFDHFLVSARCIDSANFLINVPPAIGSKLLFTGASVLRDASEWVSG